jgi:hypothetical protein
MTPTERQDAYALANFRFGVRASRVFGEVWVRNAFDTSTPTAFATRACAVGVHSEKGPATDAGVRVGVSF